MGLIEKDLQYIWHPFTKQKKMQPPIAIVRGRGAILIDEQENEYIDAISSWWVNLHGHAHPYIAKKIYEQAQTLEQVIFAGFTHPPAVHLAERLIKILPPVFSKIFYSDNGSTSTEVAIKMALQYWVNMEGPTTKRKKILAFNNSYHGDTFGAMSVSDRSVFTLAFQDLLFEVIFIDTPTVENIQHTMAIINEHHQNIAAFIYEPLVQGAGGMKMYDAALLDNILQTLKKQHTICIADEVMTGFGRTGKLFASEYLHHLPDIICLSKGLTGGTMALGVTACAQKIYDAFVDEDPLKTFFHGHSFTANPLACTAAIASLDLLEKADCRKAIALITEAQKSFAQCLENQNLPIKNVRTLGTILAFEYDYGKDHYLNSISTWFTQKSIEKGVYMRPLGNTIYWMPPYCINEEQLNYLYQIVLEIIKTENEHFTH